MKVVISSGHGKYVAGADDVLNEVEEARKVVERVADYLEQAGVEVVVFHDDTSRDQDTNLATIVAAHNEAFDGKGHDWDFSVHFNMSEGGTTDKPIGTEVWHQSDETKQMAIDLADAMARASGLNDRGPKQNGLYFLSHTIAKACLLEVAFVNSTADASLYESAFDAICVKLAETIAGAEIADQPPDQRPPVRPQWPSRPDRPDNDWPLNPRNIPVEDRPLLMKGDEGPHVLDLQRLLPRFPGDFDGDFGEVTEDAVFEYQKSRNLHVDGEVGEETWTALYTHKLPAVPPPAPPGALTSIQQIEIMEIANESDIADYAWADRGVAPTGWTQGMALSYGQCYLKWKVGHPAALRMAKKRSSSDKDVCNEYRKEFDAAGMSNETDGVDTLRHLFALMIGHGMRESSGQHCCGRDQSADNVQSETCEAGAFQTSYNAHSASDPEFSDLMQEYEQGLSPGYLDAFSEGVSCSSSDWDNYGSGVGEQFQYLCKNQPAFSVETCGLTLRSLCNHYGPILRHESELKKSADAMLRAVQDYLDTTV